MGTFFSGSKKIWCSIIGRWVGRISTAQSKWVILEWQRWSATSHNWNEEVQFTLLTADTGARPPVAPSQSYLVVDSLGCIQPSSFSASGVMDKPVGYCVDGSMNALMDSPEQQCPVLLFCRMFLVASGKRLSMQPTPSCPCRMVFSKITNASFKQWQTWLILLIMKTK